jgi:hypothetical protein
MSCYSFSLKTFILIVLLFTFVIQSTFYKREILMNFDEKAGVVSTLWFEFRNSDEFADFVTYNDIGCPLAYMYANGLVKELSEQGIEMITETFGIFLELLDVTEDVIDEILPDKNLGAILVFAKIKAKISAGTTDVEEEDEYVFHTTGERIIKLDEA